MLKPFSLRPPLRWPGAPEPSDPLAADFSLLYGRAPTGEERERLEALGVRDAPSEGGRMRRIIAATDRQVLQTPFFIQLGPDDVEWTTIDGVEFALDGADVAVSRVVAAGAYEPHVQTLFRRELKPGMVVCDVGANVGFHSLLAAHLVGASGRVLAFEPNSENARLILMSRERNGAAQLDLHPFALSARTGFIYFSTAMGSNGGRLPDTQAVLSSAQCMVVPTRRLDEVAPTQVDFIKMDVEGAEASVLAGATGVLDACRPVIVSEFSPEMLTRVSGVSPIDFLQTILGRDYEAAVLEKGGGETPISGAAAFVADYGSVVRIEDLVFRPRERTV